MRSYLPRDKQFLITRNGSAAALDSLHLVGIGKA
jgi:hypothetical protein